MNSLPAWHDLPAWLDKAVRHGHTMEPDPDQVPAGLNVKDSFRWTCVTCGAVAVQPGFWALAVGALAEPCDAP